jgi:hypothetical protein
VERVGQIRVGRQYAGEKEHQAEAKECTAHQGELEAGRHDAAPRALTAVEADVAADVETLEGAGEGTGERKRGIARPVAMCFIQINVAT